MNSIEALEENTLRRRIINGETICSEQKIENSETYASLKKLPNQTNMQTTPTAAPAVAAYSNREALTTEADTTTNTEAAAVTIKRRLSECSADEYFRHVDTVIKNGGDRNLRKMWRNELLMNSNSTDAQPQQQRQQWRQKYYDNDNNDGILDDDDGSDRINNKRYHVISDIIDVGIRIAIVLIFIKLETTTAFQRNIHVEELWLYKNPRTPDIVSPRELVISVIVCPFVVTLLYFMLTRDRRDFRAASWTWTLVLCLNGMSTSLLKITTGRPRPDFFYRCFPDGNMVANTTPTAVNFNCTGKWRDINEGYKSFPSGHSSFAFASFGFITFYMGAKLHAFNPVGRGETWRLLASVAPLLLAALIAVSRTCDYHHHWQDVSVGAVIGLTLSYLVYRQYYPSIFAHDSHQPLPRDGRRRIYKLRTTSGKAAHHQYKRLNCIDASDEDEPLTPKGAIITNGDACDGDKRCDEQFPLICDDRTAEQRYK